MSYSIEVLEEICKNYNYFIECEKDDEKNIIRKTLTVDVYGAVADYRFKLNDSGEFIYVEDHKVDLTYDEALESTIYACSKVNDDIYIHWA